MPNGKIMISGVSAGDLQGWMESARYPKTMVESAWNFDNAENQDKLATDSTRINTDKFQASLVSGTRCRSITAAPGFDNAFAIQAVPVRRTSNSLPALQRIWAWFPVTLGTAGVYELASALRSDSLDSTLPFWEHDRLRIISERRIREFGEKYSDATLALANWMRAVRAAAWRTQAEVKGQFHDSDLVGDKTVFNIANNRYRLVAYISFRTQILYIKNILTHREYDKGNWKQ